MKKALLSLLGICACLASSAATSPTIYSGTLPYSEGFAKDEDGGFYFFSEEGSGKDWDITYPGYSSNGNYALRCYATRIDPTDAYAVSPGFSLEKGKIYEFSFKTGVENSSHPKDLVVKFGSEPTAEGLATTLYSENITNAYTSYATKYMFVSPIEDGIYYFAFHYYEEYGDVYYLFVDDVSLRVVEKSPAPVSDLAVAVGEKGAMQATISWTNPNNDIVGEALDHITKAEIMRDGSVVGTVTDGLIPGESASFTDTEVDTDGKHTYSVTVYLDDNSSDAVSVTSEWIGKDTKIGEVSNVAATVIGDGTQVEVTFTPNYTGANGGYVDPVDVYYRIDRKGVNSGTVVAAENFADELPFVDNVTALDSYTYMIYTYYRGTLITTSTWSVPTSNAVVAGGAASLPYSQDFSKTPTFFTFAHAGGTNYDWTDAYQTLRLFQSSNTSYNIDAYAFTPGFDLEPGKAYELYFESYKLGNDKNLQVILCDKAQIDSEVTVLFEGKPSNTSSYSPNKYTTSFGVEKAGRYYIAFRGYDPSYLGYLYVDNIKLQEIQIVPLAVNDLTAEVAEKGEMKVTLTWTNPVLNNAGGTLSSLTKAVVTRGDTQFEILDAVPGQESTYTDTSIEKSGTYTYSVTVYVDENASEPVEVTTTWVGLDTPKPVENVVATLDDINSEMIVTWDAVNAVGVNGGYVDVDNIRYNVVRMPDSKEVASATSENEAVDDVEGVALQKYWYEVSLDGYADVAAASSEKVLLGDALDLPYEVDLTVQGNEELWSHIAGEDGASTWSYSSYDKALCSDKSNPFVVTPPFVAGRGLYTLTYSGRSLYSLYKDAYAAYLIPQAKSTRNAEEAPRKAPSTNAEEYTHLKTTELTSVSSYSPNTEEIDFEIPSYGVYHIGFQRTGNGWGAALQSTKIELKEKYSGVDDVAVENDGLFYNPTDQTVYATGAEVIVCRVDGAVVGRSSDGSFDMSDLAEGVYVARCGASTIKFVK